MNDDLEKKLREMGKEQVEYPPDLEAATRAEFTTHLRTMKKRKGCPFFILLYFGLAIEIYILIRMLI